MKTCSLTGQLMQMIAINVEQLAKLLHAEVCPTYCPQRDEKWVGVYLAWTKGWGLSADNWDDGVSANWCAGPVVRIGGIIHSGTITTVWRLPPTNITVTTTDGFCSTSLPFRKWL